MESDKKSEIMSKAALAVKKEEDARAPKITAKGKGYNAVKILDLAFEHGVKVRQDAELTSILKELDVDSPVPLEALDAVSIILQKVYEANASLKAKKDNEEIE
ncbi:hypothetical protein GCM10017044_22610 [Kordiimonas sediminis]|uniref:Flagellar protein FhlB n=1 Tax=Kordiimonas sediminis TaxID=1735581 RepID=A0A919AV35_9PROT|nr:EscU/YscU/HrcU family type III secretion system export apparatus switch protein [Kordiimonas sediminis]GHF27046.1 hypothetical protein GCM10017044_22610 [Kordiimonas sediminis]